MHTMARHHIRAAIGAAVLATIAATATLPAAVPTAKAATSSECDPERFATLYWCEDFSSFDVASIGKPGSDWVIDLNGGSATINQDELVLSAPSGRTFPYLRRSSTSLRFPQNGAFRLIVGLRYQNVGAPHGTSVSADPTLVANGSNAGAASWRMHHDASNTRLFFNACGPTVYSYSENGLSRRLEVLFDGDGGATTMRDGTQVAACSPIAAGTRPKEMYLGNPVRTALSAPWATVRVDYIRVEIPCEERGLASSIVASQVEPRAGDHADDVKQVNCDRVVPLGL